MLNISNILERHMIIYRWKQHLRDSGWSYFQHMSHGLHQVGKLAVITFKGLVHSFVPGIWASAAPIGIYNMYKDLKRHKHVQKAYERHDQGRFYLED